MLLNLNFNTSRLGKLNDKEVDYWKMTMLKTLKTGIEIEIECPREMQISQGRRMSQRSFSGCNANGRDCPCRYWSDCEARDRACAHHSIRAIGEAPCNNISPSTCIHAVLEGCGDDCDGCPDYSFYCDYNVCNNYLPMCYVHCSDRHSARCDSCEWASREQQQDRTAIGILTQALRPTRSVDYIGEFGVFEVKEDHSIEHGVEVVTVGRRYNWNEFYAMNQKIIDKLKELNCFTSLHCSIHYHILTGYNNRGDYVEAERPIPEIILANFYQLCRIFTPELFWITSAGETDYALTRYTLFRQPLFRWKPINTSMAVVKNSIRDINDRYSMFNLSRASISGRNINRFHVELRFPDSNLSPTCITAYASMINALLIKAVELSRFGIVDYSTEDEQKSIALFNKLANLGTGDRDSYTAELTGEDIELLQLRTGDMIRFIKGQLLSLDNYSYEVLSKIAITPPSYLRAFKGMDWDQIEEYYLCERTLDSTNIERIIEAVELQLLSNQPNLETWKQKIAEIIGINGQKMSELMGQLRSIKIVGWDEELGQPIFK